MLPQAKECQELEEARKVPPPEPPQRDPGPAAALILYFWPPEPGENKGLLFWATQFVAVCYGSHRELSRPQVKDACDLV